MREFLADLARAGRCVAMYKPRPLGEAVGQRVLPRKQHARAIDFDTCDAAHHRRGEAECGGSNAAAEFEDPLAGFRRNGRRQHHGIETRTEPLSWLFDEKPTVEKPVGCRFAHALPGSGGGVEEMAARTIASASAKSSSATTRRRGSIPRLPSMMLAFASKISFSMPAFLRTLCAKLRSTASFVFRTAFIRVPRAAFGRLDPHLRNPNVATTGSPGKQESAYRGGH